jgi:predicted hydrocarbon binding protein
MKHLSMREVDVMAHTVRWNTEDGTILLDKDGQQERVILLRRGFWDGFLPEVVGILGEDGMSVMMRNLVKRVGLADEFGDKPNFRTLIQLFDKRILPVDRANSDIHETVTWEKDDREIKVFGNTTWILQDIFTIQQFKGALADVLNENGAKAIIRSVSKKGGLSVAETALDNYGWKDIEDAMASQNERVYAYTFGVAGWCQARSAHQVGPDGEQMLVVICDNTYESEGVTSKKPTCSILSSYMEGFYKGVFSRLANKTVECREVACRAVGADHCTFAFKMKDVAAEPLDWDELAGEWQALEKQLIG